MSTRVVTPTCRGRLATRPVWKCSGCAYQFSVTAGTIFAAGAVPVRGRGTLVCRPASVAVQDHPDVPWQLLTRQASGQAVAVEVVSDVASEPA